jgi:hypothetical protein
LKAACWVWARFARSEDGDEDAHVMCGAFKRPDGKRFRGDTTRQ